MHTLTLPKKKSPNRLIAGFTALAASAFITASGFAAAAPMHKTTNPPANNNGCTKSSLTAQEKKDCETAATANANQEVQSGQVVNIGHGYGGGNTSVAANINLNLNNSNNNIIHVIFNILNH
jgi:poly(3-hydroxybutyrate) depolymerase